MIDLLRFRSWFGLVLGTTSVVGAGFLSIVSSPRYFAICTSASVIGVVGILFSTLACLWSKRLAVRIPAVVLVGVGLLTFFDTTSRARYAWYHEKEMRFACRVAADCGTAEFISGPGDGYLSACGRLFEIEHLGNSVHLKRNGQLAGLGFADPGGEMTDVGWNCAPTLWNRAIAAERVK